ncbi:MAG: CPBP family intramembrane glutamic endopeptidase [Candidatus Marinimicrobia bacterium]|nr:CPBP family intramembrane glutamic endopeptidase [Candidatus Neomarinimicrobiota bacterium]
MKHNSLHIFTTREAYLLVATSMFMGLFVSLAFQGIFSGRENAALLGRIVVLLGELAILLPPLLILKQRNVKLQQVLPLKQISPVTAIMAIVLVAGVIGLVSVFEVVVLPYFPIPDFLKQLESDLIRADLIDNLVLIIASTLAAPLVEEFIFRGIMQQSLFYRYGSLMPAIVVPTVIFALFHVAYLFYLPALIELIALAILLAWLMIKTGNIFIPILVHGLFNLSSFFGVFITDLEEVTSLADLGILWITLSVILSVIGWFYFKQMHIVVFEEVYLIPPLREKEV